MIKWKIQFILFALQQSHCFVFLAPSLHSRLYYMQHASGYRVKYGKLKTKNTVCVCVACQSNMLCARVLSVLSVNIAQKHALSHTHINTNDRCTSAYVECFGVLIQTFNAYHTQTTSLPRTPENWRGTSVSAPQHLSD
jgi:hypothetical protein